MLKPWGVDRGIPPARGRFRDVHSFALQLAPVEKQSHGARRRGGEAGDGGLDLNVWDQDAARRYYVFDSPFLSASQRMQDQVVAGQSRRRGPGMAVFAVTHEVNSRHQLRAFAQRGEDSAPIPNDAAAIAGLHRSDGGVKRPRHW